MTWRVAFSHCQSVSCIRNLCVLLQYVVIYVKGKTPISHLQELCNKWGIVPLYELVASEGPTHEPMFEFSVRAREYSATGKG